MADSQPPDCQLYLITPPQIDPSAFQADLAAALNVGNIAAVQLRLKDASDRKIKYAAKLLAPIVRAKGVSFIINDRPDLASEIGCDGVHIGQDDAEYKIARASVGDKKIVGVTCHNSRHLAMIAGEQGADYVAFGAFFPTRTKQAKYIANLDLIKWWSELMLIPAVAIGGITPENCCPLVRAGADLLAVSSSVWDHPNGPAAAVSQFNKVMKHHRP